MSRTLKTSARWPMTWEHHHHVTRRASTNHLSTTVATDGRFTP